MNTSKHTPKKIVSFSRTNIININIDDITNDHIIKPQKEISKDWKQIQNVDDENPTEYSENRVRIVQKHFGCTAD